MTICAKEAQKFAVRWYVTQGRSAEALMPLILAGIDFEYVERADVTMFLDANAVTA